MVQINRWCRLAGSVENTGREGKTSQLRCDSATQLTNFEFLRLTASPCTTFPVFTLLSPEAAQAVKSAKQRKGVACVELAVSLPLLIFVGFASFAICNYLSMQQAASRIAFDTCHKAQTDDLTAAEAKSLATSQLTSLGFQGSAEVTETSVSTQTSLFTIKLTATSDLQKSLKLVPGLDVVKTGSSILRKK